MKNRARLAIALGAMLMASGCVVKQTYSVADLNPTLAPAGRGAVAVGSQDRRSYVVSGKNEPQIVGILRAGFGNPYHMNTTSGRPFADEVGEVIAGALESKGFTTKTVIVGAAESIEQARTKLASTGADKLVHLQIIEWKSDTYVNIGLEYSLRLAILDREGKLLAEKEISGDENLGSAGFDTAKGVKKKVPAAFRQKLEELFSTAEIVEALN